MSEAKLKEVVVSASAGGKVQIVKYEYSEDYGFSMTQRFDVEGMDEEEAMAFRQNQIDVLREHLGEICQREVDRLMAERDRLNN